MYNANFAINFKQNKTLKFEINLSKWGAMIVGGADSLVITENVNFLEPNSNNINFRPRTQKTTSQFPCMTQVEEVGGEEGKEEAGRQREKVEVVVWIYLSGLWDRGA